MINVAINGFGRIGRMIFRAGFKDKKINFVAINDLTPTDNLAYLLKYDSAHGKFNGNVSSDKNSLIIGDSPSKKNKKIPVFSEKDPAKLPWKKLKVDVVIESTGFFLTKELASKHLKAGAKKVILSAPAKNKGDNNDIKTLVYGVNHKEYNQKKDNIISNASCTTNCLAPIAKVLDDNFGIISGLVTTVHAYTSTQKVVDLASSKHRRGRAAAVNMIPTTTGAAIATTLVLPKLKDKIDGMAIRVPVVNGSIVDFTCQLKQVVDVEKVNSAFEIAARSKDLKNVFEYSEEELVSTDILTNPHSSIFDSKLTKVINGNSIKVFSWYDNEWGYSNRIIDMVKIML
ncbi:type I glyceraldehyde-3-phosphate dehydrogenase [archaeon]|jgi:glyceraldehyde 3-phosphate dehydrogenase|nr:type I glyceraldehyde-3-phosphate dehydrogenase [archaeon]MBT3451131.1 type I glyceraldehyde-3-phosphate dehydrogenase [archaeon]MBT6869535.1 type I glyceraldehyde-3-phosphate dehydrogenase [archaeon]MBT7193700.1 type I glyceraldehyde-3-phosphate dehydrogenase [archaeon]MBT7380391.1 type I glyceraldehyde-3-phosphate dehydrogenase [archaeon]